MAEIVLHEEANFDIETIYRFSQGQFGAAVADDYHDGLLDAVLSDAATRLTRWRRS